MKDLSKIFLAISGAFMFAALLNTDEVVGLVAVGLFVFCYVYDENLRRKFHV